MSLLEKLKEQGWYLTEEGLKKLTIIDNVGTEDVNKIVSLALNFDFKDIASGALPAKPDSNGTIRGRIVLQIQKMRNISAPKANEESTTAPRFLQLELTDGSSSIPALEFERIGGLNLNVPPGTKLFMKCDKLTIVNGFVALKASDVHVLGGKVEPLVEKWELARQMLKYARNNRRLSGSAGPPPWIAFGKRLDAHKDALPTDRNFKSLQMANEKDKNSKENQEFNESRTQAIAEASKAGQKKVFGGGQQNILDHNVKKILEKGYLEEEAKQALKSNNNNLERALYNLKRKNNSRSNQSENAAKPIIVSAGRQRDKGRSFLAKEETIATKPQANVSLFDFLTEKLPPPVSAETFNGSLNKARGSKDDSSLKSQPSNSNLNRFENNMSSSFAANRATVNSKSEEKQALQPSTNNFNRKQEENYFGQISKRAVKGGERGNSNRSKTQIPNNKMHNKTPQSYEENLNTDHQTKRNENRPFKKDRDQKQTTNDYSENKRSKGSKSAEKITYQTRDVSRNNRDSKNNGYQQKHMKKTNTYGSDLDSLVNSTSKLNIQSTKDTFSNKQPNSGRNLQSSASVNQKISEQPQKPEIKANNFPQKSPKFANVPNVASKSLQNSEVYGSQLGNGFAYDPSRIVGFQSKEANEYAFNVLKSQGMTLQQIQQQQIASPQPQQSTHLSPHPPELSSQASSVTFLHQNSNVYVAQSQQDHPSQFGMLSADVLHWKVGDLCLAKYWDDGNFYNAKITAISEKTCVVLFLGYGNYEEVLKSDCVPIMDSQQLHLASYQPHLATSTTAQPTQQRSNIHSGIGCSGNQRYRSERQMYVPPPKRTNN